MADYSPILEIGLNHILWTCIIIVFCTIFYEHFLRHLNMLDVGTNTIQSVDTKGTQTLEQSVDTKGTQTDTIYGAFQDNIMIGPNCRQYSINRTRGYGAQYFAQYGSGNTQYILVIMDSSELQKFLDETNFSTGEETSIHLKIKQKSEKLTPDEIEIQERIVVKALNDCDSEKRKELDEILKKYDVLFESAMIACMDLKFRIPLHQPTIESFIDLFNHEDNLLMQFILRKVVIDASLNNLDLQLYTGEGPLCDICGKTGCPYWLERQTRGQS